MFSNFVSTASNIGGRRYMQDEHGTYMCEHPTFGTFWVLFVADGHGGNQASQIVRREFLPHFRRALDVNKGDFEQALSDTFTSLNELTKDETSGTTLSAVIVSENQEKAYVAILGDSPVIGLCRDDVMYLSPEHNVGTNRWERKGAIKRGAAYKDGYIHKRGGTRGIQVSRALGDSYMGSLLNREPEIFVMELDSKHAADAFILATDGIWDPQQSKYDQSFEMLRALYREGKRAEGFVRDALEYSGDNITVVTWVRNP